MQDTILRGFATLGMVHRKLEARSPGLEPASAAPSPGQASDVREAGAAVKRSTTAFDEQDGRIARIRAYYFCPETMREVGRRLGLEVITGLYRFPVPVDPLKPAQPEPYVEA